MSEMPYEEKLDYWFQRLVEAGHTPKMDEDDPTKIDLHVEVYVEDEDHHNGPMCTVCYESWCIHCDDVQVQWGRKTTIAPCRGN
ncbi:hypothetical protein J2J97_32150 (plasmid) [Rhizobium bangladeshense]|uniref:hypothetical protein n=1 Tax=Rhizobium bangladeshense TaxID=1138189 RepID=UPI001A995066|nr:hypothetical protein [Rhizobium bangladeshense]QSY98558.1 hypothetical protein J2J97_32150 [Rhizobium bangladeshense]